jgi:hypothetical protein
MTHFTDTHASRPRPSSRLTGAVALAVGALMLAACGGGSGEAPPVVANAAADTVGPVVTITKSAADAVATGDVTFTFNFNEDVGTSFTVASVTVTGGTKGTFTRVSGTRATLVVTPTTNTTGTIVVTLAAGAAKDAAGNNSSTASASQAYNTVIPVVETRLVTFSENQAPVLTGFGGAEDASITADPTDASNRVAKVVKSATAELWAGTTVSICPSDAIVTLPFSATNKSLTARVWAPAAGIPVRLKVENAADGSQSVETEATTTVANAWQTLIFNFANQATGTAALNLANTYNKASIFFNFGRTGAQGGGGTYYFDDLSFRGSSFAVACPSASGPAAATGTITMDEATPPTLTGFGGAEDSSVVADPTNAANKVAKVVKSATAELWAGTTVSTLANQAIPTIGFSATNKIITVRVWSPASGIPVRLKVENAADNTKTAETEATTTAANAWQTLSFNFANQATGTAALDLTQTFNKVSIFFNFGRTGAQGGGGTFYFEDIVFPAAATTTTPPSTGSVNFSTGFGTAATVQGGAYGGYSGSSVDGFNCGAPASCGSGGSFTPAVAAADSGFYYYYQTPSAVTSLYAGIYVQAPGLTTGLSGTGDTAGVSINGKTTMKFSFGQNPEWFSSATKNFGVILTLGKYYNVGSASAPAACNIKLLAVVTPTAQPVTAYSIPISSFGLIQTCNVAGLTPASALALGPLSQVDFQAVGSGNPLPAVGGKLVGANMSVPTGTPAVYPTTLVVNGGISFE